MWRVVLTLGLAGLAILCLVTWRPWGESCHRNLAPSSGGPTHAAPPAERELRKSPYVTLFVTEKDPNDASSGLAVKLAGALYSEGVSRACQVSVCGLPVAVNDDGSFRATRVFPRPGEYVVSARIECPFNLPDRSLVTDCRVSVASSEDEAELIRELLQGVVGPGGVVDTLRFRALTEKRDLRIVPALWQVLDANPGVASFEREYAASLICRLPHLDSIPRLILMMKDPGIGATVYRQLRSPLLRSECDIEELGMHPLPPSEPELDRMVEIFQEKFRRAEARLRRDLHQP